MSTSRSDVIARACRLPVDAVEYNKSAIALIDESGFRHHQAEISVADLERHLAAHPELIDAWLLLSEDKRTASGWYVDGAKGAWVVGFLDDARPSRTTTYTDRTEACANFVFLELADIAESSAMLSSPLSVFRAVAGWLRSR